MHSAVALVALALGYKVFADAHKEKEGLKLLGQIVGIVVMLGAVLCILCGAAKCLTNSQCSMMSNNGCPLAAKTAYSMSDMSGPAK